MNQPIHLACIRGELGVVRALLESGVNPSLRGYGNNTPLHYAAQFVHLEVVKELLAAGADISREDNGGRTPIETMDIEHVYEEELSEEDFYEIQRLLREQEEEIKEPGCE